MSGGISTLTFWDTVVVPALDGWGIARSGLRLACRGRAIPLDLETTLSAAGVAELSTVDVVGRLPSQGFSQLHQLMEHLLEMLAPVAPASAAPPAAEEASSAREPIMHAIDAEIKRASAWQGADCYRVCSCLSCAQQPNSTLWLCGALLHSTDAAVVNITFRVVQLLLHARTDCPAPIVYFDEDSGALTLGARAADFQWLFEAVQDALTPEGVAIASLLSQRLVTISTAARQILSHPLHAQRPLGRPPAHPPVHPPARPPARPSRVPSPPVLLSVSPSRVAPLELALLTLPHQSQRRDRDRDWFRRGASALHGSSSPPHCPPGDAIAWAQVYDAKTHPLLWQHPTKKQTLLELAARSSWPSLLQSLLPALNLSRLAGSGALSAGTSRLAPPLRCMRPC